jgi:acyl-coenzyme A thioesterase PaaI-like protein
MTTATSTPPERQPSSRTCFVCGRDNPAGLRARFVADRASGEVRTTVVVPETMNGFPGTVHGGILGALLDEAAVRTGLLDGGFEDLMVTGRLALAYRRPTPTETPLTVVARLVKRTGSRATAIAEIRLPDGTVTATAEALLLRPPPEVASAWEAEREHWRIDDEPPDQEGTP